MQHLKQMMRTLSGLLVALAAACGPQEGVTAGDDSVQQEDGALAGVVAYESPLRVDDRVFTIRVERPVIEAEDVVPRQLTECQWIAPHEESRRVVVKDSDGKTLVDRRQNFKGQYWGMHSDRPGQNFPPKDRSVCAKPPSRFTNVNVSAGTVRVDIKTRIASYEIQVGVYAGTPGPKNFSLAESLVSANLRETSRGYRVESFVPGKALHLEYTVTGKETGPLVLKQVKN